MIRRASVEDAAKLSEWVLRDFEEASDFTGFLSNPLNVALICGGGCACFVWHGPGIYEVHVAFEQRGKAAMQVCSAAFDIMRSEHGAKLFWAAVPIHSRRVIMFTRLMGWKSQGFADLPQGRCELFTGE
jgi:hypothetical protein